MNKIGLIIGREYFTRVKKKSFLLTTILVPIVILGFYAAIIAISIKGSAEKQAIAVIDESKLITDSIASASKQALSFTVVKDKDKTAYMKAYKDDGYKAILYIPPINIDTPKGIVLHSASTLSMSTVNAAEKFVNNALESKRLQESGIDPAKYKSISANVSIENTIDTNEGSKKSVAGVAYIVSLACGMLIYLMMIIYGTQVMRGVTEEKTNRIAEVVVSSVKPFQLMMGKIIGIGAVGLTQFAIWIVLGFVGQMLIPILFPDMFSQMGDMASNGAQSSMLTTFTQGFASLPLFKIGAWFTFYFLAGYLTYASLFAAVGSVVSEDQQEAQQLMFPILMPIILGFVIMMQAINEPNSGLAVFGSLFPLTSPIVMMGRITYEIPFWQLAASAILLVGTFIFLTWITGKIYRTGILMYGKKPSWKEMMKWAFRKS